MSNAFPTIQQHHDAVKAALEAAQASPFDYDEAIPSDNTAHTLLAVRERVTGGVPRQSGLTGIRAVSVSVRAVGITADNVRAMLAAADTLRERRLTIAGHTSTRLAFETAEQVGPDGDPDTTGRAWYSARITFTYTV